MFFRFVIISVCSFLFGIVAVQAQAVQLPAATPARLPQLNVADAARGFVGASDVDSFTGVLTYRQPLAVPAGRLDMSPQLALTYSNSDQRLDSIIGLGWDLSLPRIYRSSARGVDTLYSRSDFSADVWGRGGRLALVDAATGSFAADTEQDFSSYRFTGTSWQMTDTAGSVYTFGDSAATRQADPADSTRVYSWLVSRIEDANGNFMSFTYFADGGQIYPASIRYTGHGSDLGSYEIVFDRAARPTIASYQRGFRVATSYRISALRVLLHAGASIETLRAYEFSNSSLNAAHQYLSAITIRSGSDSLPPTEFSYFAPGESGGKAHYLKSVANSLGGTESFRYEATTMAGIKLPFILWTLASRTQSATLGAPESVTSYAYFEPHFYFDQLDAYRRDYAGFGCVEITRPDGAQTLQYFHQSQSSFDGSHLGEFADHISKKGRLYRQEIRSAGDDPLETRIWKWEAAALPDISPDRDRYFVRMTRETTVNYGDSGMRARAVEYSHDAFGNLTTAVDFGEVMLAGDDGSFADTGIDRIITTHEYAAGARIHRLPSREVLTDQSGAVAREARYFYDNLDFGSVSLGNRTRIEQLIAGSDYAGTTMTYDSRGLVTVMTDPLGFATELSYDPAGLYPSTTENTLGQITQFEYNYLTGEVASQTEPSGLRTSIIRDGFGRPTAVQISDPATPSALITAQSFEYDLVSSPARILEIRHLTSSVDSRIATYLDAFARVIQRREEAANCQYRVTTLGYDAAGRKSIESVPIFGTGEAFAAIPSVAPSIEYVYDALDRPVQITNPLGSTATEYDGWDRIVTDPLDREKKFSFDSRGNLAQVTEYTDSQAAVTSYSYDALGNLTQHTDAAGNIRMLTYDARGLLLSEEPLHNPNASVLPTYYTYDAAGNRTSQTMTDGRAIVSTYDALNRIIAEDDPITTPIEASYSYDSGSYGAGRLASISYPLGSTSYGYDVLGRRITETKTIDTTSYSTQRGFDLFDNPLSETYPSGLVIDYSYDSAGQLTAVTRGGVAVVSGLAYTPAGQLATITFANGVTTTDTFDPAQLWRLTHRLTTRADNTKLQDLSYSYDAVGNITQIIDASDTLLAREVSYSYDDLDRLTSATVSGAQPASESYAYDLIGNITNHSAAGSYSYSGLQPHAVSQAGNTTYLYDAVGRLIERDTTGSL